MFKFEMNSRVEIIESGETGVVVGRAEHNYCDAMYQVRYRSADGRAVEVWWTETSLRTPEA